ncbi:VOC family protein [Brevibacillus daliensis]|uniref:VOC family protein n=1 Tax=Brevibacillus daliensis TaxID=2892995 RepID=UPI001E4795ED|nr:VOC family protein [Brevibacillus daliensis]
MISVSPFIVVEDCKETIEYYQSILGGEIKLLNGSPEKMNHAELHVGNSHIHISGSFGKPIVPGDNTRIIMVFESEEEIRHVFQELSKDGKVTIDLMETFFGALHGQVTDKYNVNWVMNYFLK